MGNVVATSSLLRRTPRETPSKQEPILLVTPPSGFLLDERVFMSLGILKVACLHVARHPEGRGRS
jgi:hypothetical protein